MTQHARQNTISQAEHFSMYAISTFPSNLRLWLWHRVMHDGAPNHACGWMSDDWSTMVFNSFGMHDSYMYRWCRGKSYTFSGPEALIFHMQACARQLNFCSCAWRKSRECKATCRIVRNPLMICTRSLLMWTLALNSSDPAERALPACSFQQLHYFRPTSARIFEKTTESQPGWAKGPGGTRAAVWWIMPQPSTCMHRSNMHAGKRYDSIETYA